MFSGRVVSTTDAAGCVKGSVIMTEDRTPTLNEVLDSLRKSQRAIAAGHNDIRDILDDLVSRVERLESYAITEETSRGYRYRQPHNR